MVVVVCACDCSMCVYVAIVNSCARMHFWIMCVAALIRGWMHSLVVCEVVWLFGVLCVFVLLRVCVPCLRVCM